MATMVDVAKRANLSTAIVSHVINNTKHVSEESKKRVIAAIDELGFEINFVAKGLKSRKTNIIGAVLPLLSLDHSNVFFLDAARAIEDELHDLGYSLMISNSSDDSITEQEKVSRLRSQQVRGLIVATAFSSADYYYNLPKRNEEVIFIDRKPNRLKSDCIYLDGADASIQVVDKLTEKGHQRIGFIKSSSGFASKLRHSGFLAALKKHRLPRDESLIASSSSTIKGGYEATETLLRRAKGISALYVSNNQMLIGTLLCLKSKKMKIPDSIAVVGFDDYDWCAIAEPPLTMVKQPAEEMGRQAARMLVERIENHELPKRQVILRASLVIRESM